MPPTPVPPVDLPEPRATIEPPEPDEPPVPPTETADEPLGPEVPALVKEGFSQVDVEKFEAQTGNILADLANGNIPLGNRVSSAVWSLLSLILSAIAAIISILLVIGEARRRRKDGELDGYEREEAERRQKRGRVLKAPACIVGVLTLVVWLALDDLSLPVAWINKYTVVAAIVFAVHLALFALYKARKGKRAEDVGKDEADSGVA